MLTNFEGTVRRSLRSLTEGELLELVADLGEKKFRADQISNWLHNQDVAEIEEMVNIPAPFREQLSQSWTIEQLTEQTQQESNDGTVKWLYRTEDGYSIECVLIPSDDRNSLCVSTQVGCAMGCTFCRTAKMGFRRNLSCGEILEQFVRTRRWIREHRPESGELTNVVFMGMGEPMNNLDEVEKSVRWLHHQKRYDLSRKRITISTSGVVPGIEEFARRRVPAQLAISLNGSNQETRAATMPVARRWPLDQLLAAVDFYIETTDQVVTFEYVLIQGVTCSDRAAEELREIIRNRKCKVNAIPLNPSENGDLQPPTTAEIERFFTVIGNVGKHITLRKSRGQDILAACGQLAADQQKVPSC